MEKKRTNFGEEEKTRIQQLVLEKKHIIENKNSDLMSLLDKKKTWADITEEFNSSGEYPQRTTAQLKKLWENIKARKKLELREKRTRLKMITGSTPSEVPDDPDLDAVGVDDELQGAIESVTNRVEPGSSSMGFLEADPLLKEETIVEDETPGRAMGEMPPSLDSEVLRRRGPVRAVDERTSRIKRNEGFLQQSKELHREKMKEQAKKMELVDLQIERVRNDNSQEEQSKKASILLDLQTELVKKQIELEKKKDERAAQLHELHLKKLQLEIEQLEATKH